MMRVALMCYTLHWMVSTGVVATNATSCTSATPLMHGSVINVAILTWLIGEKHGWYKGASIANTTSTSTPGYGRKFVQTHNLAVDMFVQRMRIQGALPLNNNQSVSFNFVYLNLGGLNYTNTYSYLLSLGVKPALDFSRWGTVDYTHTSSTGFPFHMVGTTSLNIPGSAGTPGGLFSKLVSQDASVLLENFGITKPFTFIIAPPLMLGAAAGVLGNYVEYPSPKAIIINPFLSNDQDFRCDGLRVNSRNPDCLTAPSYAPYERTRRQGSRRFESLLSVMVDTLGNQQSALDTFHLLKVKSVVIIVEALGFQGTNYFPTDCARYTANSAELLNIKVTEIISLMSEFCVAPPVAANLSRDPFVRAANCPPTSFVNQDNAWRNGMSGLDMATYIGHELNPDALIFIGSPSSGAGWSIGELFRGFQTIDWTPKAVSFGGGIESTAVRFMPLGALDLMHTFTVSPWDWRLKGPTYKAKRTETNFELLPADDGRDAPQVFQETYDATYGPRVNNVTGQLIPAHPMWNPLADADTGHAQGYAAMNLMLKLVENAMTADVATLIQTSKALSAPSMYHQANFDIYGRISLIPQMLKQTTPHGLELVYPFNIGVEAVYPLPTWKERVFAPVWYGETNERVMLGVTALCIAVCIALMSVVWWRRATQVIKAASPLFCMFIAVGAIMMLCSNFFHTLVTNDAHCAAQVWLLTIGFTIMFASLFVKTFRIWKIFEGRKLQVQKIRDIELMLGVLMFVLVDVIINVTWMQTVGMKSKLVQIDVLRPANDYLCCDYSDAMPAVYTHIGVKALALMVGIVLTYAVRNITSAFNESKLIAMCMYNVSVVSGFVLPIVSANLGGRNTSYMIRNFAIAFITMSTMGILFIPKLWFLVSRAHANSTAGSTDDKVTKIMSSGTSNNTAQNLVAKNKPNQSNTSHSPAARKNSTGEKTRHPPLPALVQMTRTSTLQLPSQSNEPRIMPAKQVPEEKRAPASESASVHPTSSSSSSASTQNAHRNKPPTTDVKQSAPTLVMPPLALYQVLENLYESDSNFTEDKLISPISIEKKKEFGTVFFCPVSELSSSVMTLNVPPHEDEHVTNKDKQTH